MVTRAIIVRTEMACCRDGVEAYHPLPKPVRAEVSANEFETSLTIWGDRAVDMLYAKYHQIAEDECSGMGTLGLCYFNMSVLSVEEY